MLHNIQKQFMTALFSTESNPEIVTSITESGSRNAVEQLMSYRDSVFGGISEALAISYPVVKKLIGDEFFNYLSYQYIKKYRSTSPDLNDYGHDFCKYLDTCSNLETVPYLSDVARLEWYWQKIINGSKSKPGNLNQLINLTEDETDTIIFKLSTHASVLHSNFAIHTIWQANQETNFDNAELNIDEGVNLLIWRNELDMNMTIIDENQLFFLDLIDQNLIFSDVCDKHLSRYQNDDVTTLLSNAIQSNWIHSFILNR